jgi:hypothetical protein
VSPQLEFDKFEARRAGVLDAARFAASRMPSSFCIRLETYPAIRNRIRVMAVPGTKYVVEAGIIQGQVGPETSNDIIEKGLALRPKQSGSVVASTGH